MACRTRLYTIEAWRGLDCVGWASGKQVRGLPAKANHYITDLGADRLYVRREATAGGAGDQVAAWTPGRGWVTTDDRIAAIMAERGL